MKLTKCTVCGNGIIVKSNEKIKCPHCGKRYSIVKRTCSEEDFYTKVRAKLFFDLNTPNNIINKLKYPKKALKALVPYYEYSISYDCEWHSSIGYNHTEQVKKYREVYENGKVIRLEPYLDYVTKTDWDYQEGSYSDSLSFLTPVVKSNSFLSKQSIGLLSGVDIGKQDICDISPESDDYFFNSNLDINQYYDEVAKAEVNKIIEQDLWSHLPGDTQRDTKAGYQHHIKKSRCIYYPVWIGTFGYFDKKFTLLGDGTDQNLLSLNEGEIPVDKTFSNVLKNIVQPFRFALMSWYTLAAAFFSLILLKLPFDFCAHPESFSKFNQKHFYPFNQIQFQWLIFHNNIQLPGDPIQAIFTIIWWAFVPTIFLIYFIISLGYIESDQFKKDSSKVKSASISVFLIGCLLIFGFLFIILRYNSYIYLLLDKIIAIMAPLILPGLCVVLVLGFISWLIKKYYLHFKISNRILSLRRKGLTPKDKNIRNSFSYKLGSLKSRTLAFVLCVLTGVFGGHRLYLGKGKLWNFAYIIPILYKVVKNPQSFNIGYIVDTIIFMAPIMTIFVLHDLYKIIKGEFKVSVKNGKENPLTEW